MKIKVLRTSYKIIKHEELINSEKGTYFGLTHYEKQEIHLVSKSVSKERVWQTIKHEVTHAYDFEYSGGNVFENVSEFIAEFVDRYAEDIISDSKKVYKFITGEIR